MQTAEGLLIEPVQNLKRRQLCRYWRPVKDGEGNVIDWTQTHLLPSDAVSKDNYLRKGFKLSDPRLEPPSAETKTLEQENERLRLEIERLTKPPLYVSGKKK